MQEISEKIINQLDESFRPEEPQRYSLVMEIEKRRFSYCLLDIERNRFVGLGSFPQPWEDALETLSWITNPFQSRQVIFAGCKSTLVPASLFLPEEKQDYLDFNLELEPDEIVLYNHLENLGIFNVFPVPGKMNETVSRIFPGSKSSHVSTVLIGSLYRNYKNVMGEGRMFLNVRDTEFDLVIFRGKQLNYYNSFPYKVPDDMAYFVIFVMEQLNLNPEEVPLILLGAIEKSSKYFEILFRYIRTIEFAGRNETFSYSYVLDNLPGQFFYTLFNCNQ